MHESSWRPLGMPTAAARAAKHSMRDDRRSQDFTQKPKSEGSEKDLIAYWKKLYRQKQWQRYAPFQKTRGKGDFNVPYILLKAKNMQKV